MGTVIVVLLENFQRLEDEKVAELSSLALLERREHDAASADERRSARTFCSALAKFDSLRLFAAGIIECVFQKAARPSRESTESLRHLVFDYHVFLLHSLRKSKEKEAMLYSKDMEAKEGRNVFVC